jgi:nucleoside-diphosphate-sugar epimerase
MVQHRSYDLPDQLPFRFRLGGLELRRAGRSAIDVAASVASLLLAMVLLVDLSAVPNTRDLLIDLLAFALICAVVYWASGLPRRSWRFVSMPDFFVMVRAILIAILGLAAFVDFTPFVEVPYAVPLITCFIMISALGGVRVAYRFLVESGMPAVFRNIARREPQRLLAYGANVETDAFFRSLQSDSAHRFEVVGIIDDEPANRDRCIRGVKVVGGSADLAQTVRRFADSSIKIPSLVVPAGLPRQKLREIAARAAAAGLKAVRLPPRSELLSTPGAADDLEQVDMQRGDRVLVIGGAGYIGSLLVEKLLGIGKEVKIIDGMHFGEHSLARVARHPSLEIIREDFRHIETLTRAMSGVGTVIHLAGLVGDPACATNPDLTIDINLTATKLVGEIAKAQGVRRFIYASSCSVYGACDEIVDEESSLNPQSLYARTKVASEAVLAPLNDSTFVVTSLRFATVYGVSERTRFDLVVNLLCAKAVQDRVITVFGEDQWRPFVHVDDVARALVMILQAPDNVVANEAFNVGGDDQNYTLGEVAHLIGMQVPTAEIITSADCPDKRNYRVSFRKIRSRLGFAPAWTIERGIAQLVASVRSNEVGHYSRPEYSNVRFLEPRGMKILGSYNITGWESDLMNVVATTSTVMSPPHPCSQQQVAAHYRQQAGRLGPGS